jgi:chromate reductase, NAD(P)H dehydrogenase (quinone)
VTANVPEILAIAGSLRRDSTNAAALRAAAGAARRDGIAVSIDSTLRALPHFDPDMDSEPPDAVIRFRAACERADGVLLAVPEYAFGIPGSFKNALDWTVGASSLNRKPVTVLSVAPPGRGKHVREALAHVLTAIDADPTFRSVPVAVTDLGPDGEIVNSSVVAHLRAIVCELASRSTRAAVAA